MRTLPKEPACLGKLTVCWLVNESCFEPDGKFVCELARDSRVMPVGIRKTSIERQLRDQRGAAHAAKMRVERELDRNNKLWYNYITDYLLYFFTVWCKAV